MNCYIHSDREALDICAECGKGICRECIIAVGKEYYCKKCALQPVSDLLKKQIHEKPADFTARAIAFIVDVVIIIIAWVVITIFVEYAITFSRIEHADAKSFILFLKYEVFFIGFPLYFVLMHGKYGQTIGKMATGIKVLKVTNEPITYRIAFKRFIGYVIDVLTFFIGFLVAIFNSKKRGLHDFIAGTKVVYIKERPLTIIVLGIFIFVIGSCSLIAIPNTFKVVEKSRITEAISLISTVKSAEEKYFAKKGNYTSDFKQIDIFYQGMTSTQIPLKCFTATVFVESCWNEPCYKLTLTRHTNKSAVATKYGTYSMDIIVPWRPQVKISDCPGGKGNCDELIE